MSLRQRQLPLSAGAIGLAGLLWMSPLAAAIPTSPALEESAKDLAAVISVSQSPPNVDFLVGRALLQQGKANLALGYLLMVPTTDVEYRPAQALIKSIQKPAISATNANVPTSAESAALLSISTAYEGYGWQKVALAPTQLAGIQGPLQLFQKTDQLVVGIPYHKGSLPPAKMGAQVLGAIRPVIGRNIREVHLVWFNRRFEMLEMVYTVDLRSRKFLPKTWLFNDHPIQIGYPSDVELKKLKKFVLNGF